MYSTQHSVYDSDSAASFISSTTSTPSPPVDGIILSDNVQDWFQLNQSFQSYEQEVQQSNTVYCDTTVQDESHWQYNTNGQAQNSSYTYIFDSLPDYSDSMESKGPERKTAGVKRRRVQNPHQRKAANIRERRRMSNMNEAFDELKKRLPAFEYEKKLSRIETLKLAMTYISFMKDISDGNSTNNTPLFHCQQNLDDNLLKSKEKCP